MHILLLPINYPNSYSFVSGIFFKDQAEALSLNNKVGVLALIGISVKQVLKDFKFNFGFFKDASKVVSFRYQYFSIPKLMWLNNLVRLYLGKKYFIKYISEFGMPDVVHVHVYLAGDLARWIKNRYGIPYIVTEHSTLFLENKKIPVFHQKIIARVFKDSLHNISVGEDLQKSMKDNFGIQSTIVYNTVNTSFFNVDGKIVGNKKEFTFVNIGVFNKRKNHDLLLRSFKKAFKGSENYRIIIVGGGSEKKNIVKLIKILNLSKQVILMDAATKDEIKNLLSISDCFILTSHKETFGVVLIEAMSAGLPVISTKSGGPESIITDERIGILCDFSEDSVSNAMKKATYIEWNSNFIKSEANERFSYASFNKQILPIYMEAINEKC